MASENKSARLEEGIIRGEAVEMQVEGHTIQAYRGETIAAALINAGILVSGSRDGRPRGVFCNIGVCHSCVMTVNGASNVRVCRTPVTDGCRVESQFFTKGRDDEEQV